MTTPAPNPNKLEYEIQAFILAGAALGTGLVAKFYGYPMIGEVTLAGVGLSLIGNKFLPLPYGIGGIGAVALGASYILNVPPMTGALMGVGAMLGTEAASIVVVDEMLKRIHI